MFYFIPTTYQPNTAATNRAISYIKGFSELGIETTVVYFRPDEHLDRFEQKLPHIAYKCYWDKFWFSSMPLMYLSVLCYYIHFISHLKSDDTIFIYSGADLWYWVKKLKPNVKIYLEHTENPEVVGIGGKFLTPSWAQYYKSLPKLNGLFVITTALKECFSLRGVAADKIHIANITVDSHRFENVEKTTSEKYIAYCGTASNNKDGVDQLIKAFAIVAKDIADVKLYIMGSIPKDDKAGNIKLIQESGFAERFVLTGVVSASDMPQYLKNAQVLALARPDNIQARYGFATKMGEYLMTKNPVVVTDVGDFHLFLKDKESVIFAQPDNVEDFAQKLKWVLQHEAEAETIGKNGFAVAKDNFTYLAVAEKVSKTMNLK